MSDLVILLLLSVLQASARVPKQCSAPLEYPHTRLDQSFTSRQTFSNGQKIYYSCAEDFTPSRGSRSVQCLDGEWSKLSLKCQKKSCGNAGDLPNGQFHYEGNSLIGEKVYATCNEGYTMKGLNYMMCKKSGWTGEFPTCEKEGKTSCFRPAVSNSVSPGSVSMYHVGDNLTFTCSPGFWLDGAQRITCGPGGQWQPWPPQCLPTPDKPEPSANKETGGCDVPPTINNSNVHLAEKYATVTSFASGDRVYYTCDVGYVQAGGSRYRTCRDRQWTRLYLKCEPKLCGSAGEIVNGQFTYTGVEFGDTATAVCDQGYILVGRATRNCMSNGWDGRVPVCEAVVCDDPPEATKAVRRDLQEPPFAYRGVLQYQCRTGDLVGPKEIWCTENGTWSAPPPQCKDLTCQSPNVASAFWSGGQRDLYRYRDTISIQCNKGYTLTGPSTITCARDGRWSPGLPKCRRTPRQTYKRRNHAS